MTNVPHHPALTSLTTHSLTHNIDSHDITTHQPSPTPTATHNDPPFNTSSVNTAISSPPTVTPPPPSLDSLRLKASELATTRSPDRREERRQTAKELAAAMPDCRNCHNKAKLGCTNHRCHSCCVATKQLCQAHHTDATGTKKRDTLSVSLADKEAIWSALAADDAIGQVVTGVVDEEVECGYRVRLLVNGYVCEGLLFDDTYAVTVNTLPADITTRQLQHITLDSLPPLPSTTRPLFPPSSPASPHPPAAHSKPKVRHPDGYPKGPRSGYVYYTAAMRARVQAAESEEERSVVRPEWSALVESERGPYMRLAEMDKQRWMRQMEEWKRRTDVGAGAVEDASMDANESVVEASQ